MANSRIYQDIATRTGGDIYIGVVGPVRTGKSTLIKKVMDLLVLPNIENDYRREQAQDELPQSAAGRTIMTTEPKFVPNEAVEVCLKDNARFRVRMIDCVGYLVPSALGQFEDETPRMVHTPWFEEEIPFEQAAEIGTKKVICEHSSIGILVTTDGSICSIPREDYIEAEERAAFELKAINKPFVILLNSVWPNASETEQLRCELEEKYGVPVLAVNCAELCEEDISRMMEQVLFEFPVSEISFKIPRWMNVLAEDHWLKSETYQLLLEMSRSIQKIGDVRGALDSLCVSEHVERVYIDKMDLGCGCVSVDLVLGEPLFYQILSEASGFEIDGEDTLVTLIGELAEMKREYDKVAYALHEVREKGYGIVAPTTEELQLEEPEIIRQGSRFGIRLKASAPSIHMIRADIHTEVSPIVGNERQSEELVQHILDEFKSDPKQIWESNIFGKSFYALISEGLQNKLYRMPDDAQVKLQETLQRIINEGTGGLICIIL